MKNGLNNNKSFISWLNLNDKLTFVYAFVTLIFILFNYNKVQNPLSMIGFRGIVIVIGIFLAYYRRFNKNKILELIHISFPVLLLGYWYGETGYMNLIFYPQPIDATFIHIDEILFNTQPSQEFSKLLPQAWFSELMNFAYFSYYALTFLTIYVIYFKSKEKVEKTIFLILCSFYIYYIVFIIFPVVGPQFFLPKDLTTIPDGYIFREAVRLAQHLGETPTGAFPSSHVGMTMIFLIIAFKHIKKLFPYMLIIFILLCLSTVYIKAHYVIDVIGGFISAPIIYWISIKIFNKVNKKINE